MKVYHRFTNSVALSVEARRFSVRKKQFSTLVLKILRKLGYRKAFLSLALVGDAEIRRLNRRFLKRRWATDVIAFPYASFQFRLYHDVSVLGDIVISVRRAEVNAKRFRASFPEELFRYVCHGLLHLKGYTDRTTRARRRMRQLENRLLKLVRNDLAGIAWMS